MKLPNPKLTGISSDSSSLLEGQLISIESEFGVDDPVSTDNEVLVISGTATHPRLIEVGVSIAC